MNKKVLNMMLCSLLVGSMATSFVGCKDYDDDITEINGTTGALSQQIKDLNTALEAAKADAAAAKSAAQQATDAAAKANAAAQAAAAEAKAEALKEVLAQTEKLQTQITANTNLSKENAEALAKLVGRIEGIEKGLANIDLTDVNKQLGTMANDIIEANKQISLIQTQLKALENYEATIKGINDNIADIKDQLGAIETLKNSLKELEGKVSTNAADIKTVRDELTALSGKISTEVANGVNTIAAVISQRLTSVTLMPDLYVGGIPTIAFESAQYTKLKFADNKWTKATGNNVEFIISNNETEAHYRLNPGTVTENDIKVNDMAYVSRLASARSAEQVNDLVNVNKATVDSEGQLTVFLGKSNTASLNRTDGKINTVALRVPIADAHLFTEQGETSANVYSEYTRLEEAYFQPEIIYVPGSNLDKTTNTHPYQDSTILFTSAPDAQIAKNIVYNVEDGFNLYKLIEGCKFFAPSKHEAMTIEEVRKYGMDIKFHVAKRAYQPTATDNTNQQEFVKLSGENNSVLTPITSNGLVGNKTIIGKQPIIAATMYDKVNNNVIDVRYFKVKFTADDMTPQEFTWELESDGKPCDGANVSMLWKEVVDRILTKLNLTGGEGMSKEEFNAIYGTTGTIVPANDNNGTFTINVNPEISASIPVFSWSVTEDQLGELKVGSNEANFTKTVTFSNSDGLYPDIVITFKWKVTTTVNAAALGKTDGVKWQNNTMKVYVVPMEVPYVSGTSPKAHYATNILEGRLKPYVTGLNSCEFYDINFKAGTGNENTLTFENGYGHWLMTSANQTNLDKITYSIANNAQGQALVKNGKTITLEWWRDINGIRPRNTKMIGSTDLQVLRILSLSPENATAIVDNSLVQTTDVAVTIRDAYGNLVAPAPATGTPNDAQKLAADYWDFYGVQPPVFEGVGAIEIADDATGKNSRPLASLNMTANVKNDGTLTFQNNGAPLQADAYLMVPVKVEHLWGTGVNALTGTIAVPLKKNPNLSTSSRR